ncbi:MAG TPA: hypothetical protein VEG38_19740 [Acidimicrobiia bacterium]|nr:hypothetical protein [Acidimicrobiia bacterium]
MERDQARQLAEAVAWGRIGIGITALVAPTAPLRPWVGRDFAWQPRAKLLARSLGARDVALGLGVILALRHDAPVRGWVEGGGVADAGDVLATLLAFPKLPKGGRWLVLLSAAGAAAAARLAAPALDDKE